MCVASSAKTTTPTINVKLYDYIKLRPKFVEFFITAKKSPPRSTSTWSPAVADKKPAAADPNGSAAAYDKNPPPPPIPPDLPPPPTTKPAAAAESLPPPHKTLRPRPRNFCCAFGAIGYDDHDNLDHGYITTGYLDIDIKNNVYSNSRTPVNSVRVFTCVHATPAVTAGGKRGTRRGRSHRPYMSAMLRRN